MGLHEITLTTLEDRGLITPECEFEISDKLLETFQEVYCEHKGSTRSTKQREIRFANKLAAMSLVKYKKKHGKLGSEGFLYVIHNPAWPGLYKIGITFDTVARLRSYQTYSPHRDYEILHYSFYLDTRSVEATLLGELPRYRNEWVTLTDCQLQELKIKLNTRVP